MPGNTNREGNPIMSDRSNEPTFRAAVLPTVLARHYPNASPHMIGIVVDEMQRATRKARRHAVNRCNFAISEATDARWDKAQQRDHERVTAMLIMDRLNPSFVDDAQ